MRLISRELTFATTLLIVIALFSTIAITGLSTAVADDMASPPLLGNAQVDANMRTASATSRLNELTWTTGQKYPVVNGKAVPPPQAVSPNEPPTIGPTTTGGHYYAGSVYSGTTHLATWMIMKIYIPSATPDSSQFYYVLLSAWDTHASYDQIGFANANGVWGLTYSYTTGLTTGCTGTISYHYSANAKVLTKGQLYMFAMTTVSGPGVWLEEYKLSSTGAATLEWANHYPSGSPNPGLTVQPFYCGYYDYTDYQETYGTTSSAYPSPYGAPMALLFLFSYNYWGTGASGPPWTATTWSAWHTSNAPSFNYATIGGINVIVYS
jgi:hypothetical protein